MVGGARSVDHLGAHKGGDEEIQTRLTGSELFSPGHAIGPPQGPGPGSKT